jgi:sensor histidine kinase YesM
MTRFLNSRISLKQACLLSLVVFVIYFPVTIYINVKPTDILAASGFLLFPAIISLVYYTMFIFAADRLMEKAEIAIGDKFLLDSQVPAIIVSIPVAILATIASHYLFAFSIDIMLKLGSEFDLSTRQLAPEIMENLERVNNGVTFIIMLSISYLIINRKATIKMKTLEIQSQQLINENTIAQFEALKNQVSPHFLFNSLSILSSLVHVNPDLSEQYIDKLSRAYRYILEQKDNDLIPLTTELDFIKTYAFLVKMRFENKFELKADILQDDAIRYSIAPLTLQLLVENAIKHNRMSAKEPLNVAILQDGDYLVVENEFRPREKNEVTVSTRIGLQNIKNRYNLLTSTPVEILQEDGKFKVKIPLIS